MAFPVLVGVGIALGVVLTLLARPGLGSRSKLGIWSLLFVRLAVLALVVGWSARSFGPVSGLAVLASAILTRGLLARKSGRVGATAKD